MGTVEFSLEIGFCQGSSVIGSTLVVNIPYFGLVVLGRNIILSTRAIC